MGEVCPHNHCITSQFKFGVGKTFWVNCFLVCQGRIHYYIVFSNVLFWYYSKFPSDTAHSACHMRILNSPTEMNPLRSFSMDGYTDLNFKLNFTFFKQFVSIFNNTDNCSLHIFLHTDCNLTILNTLKIFFYYYKYLSKP